MEHFGSEEQAGLAPNFDKLEKRLAKQASRAAVKAKDGSVASGKSSAAGSDISKKKSLPPKSAGKK